MSLWKVLDLATAVLMERFYGNLLTEKLPRDAALRNAQTFVRELTVGQLRAEGWLTEEMVERLAAGNAKTKTWLEKIRQQPDDHRPFAHPYYWGAFILQGETGVLPE